MKNAGLAISGVSIKRVYPMGYARSTKTVSLTFKIAKEYKLDTTFYPTGSTAHGSNCRICTYSMRALTSERK